MNPLYIYLSGFSGIRSGLGKDAFELDLLALGDAKLVAIVGPNGSGKTTLLDNLHPYRIMPSRASSYSPGGFSYFDHTYGNAEKRLIWEHHGSTYETRIAIRGGGKTKSQECFLFRVSPDDDSREPVAFDDGLMSDGKASTYDACVERIVGSPELYFTAAFACQGRKTLADYANADIKTMLSDLLGLDHIKALSERAKDIAKRIADRRDDLRATSGSIEPLRQEWERSAREARDAVQSADHEEAIRCSHEIEILAMQEQLAFAKATQGRAQEFAARRSAIKGKQIDLEVRKGEQIQAVLVRHGETQRQLDATIEAAQDRERRAQSIVERSKADAKEAKRLLERRPLVDGAALALPEEERKLAVLTAAADESRPDPTIRHRAEQEFAAAMAAGEALVRDGKKQKAVCENLRKRSALIGEVPCQGTDLQGRCKLLADAVEAAGALPDEDAELAGLRVEYDQAALAQKAAAEALEKAIHELGEAASAHDFAKQRLAAQQGIVRATAALAAEAGTFPALEARLAMAHEAGARAAMDVALAQKDALGAGAAKKKAKEDATEESDKIIARHADEATALAAELAAIPEATASRAAAIEAKISETRAAALDAENERDEQRRIVIVETERMRALEAKIMAASEAEARVESLNDESAQWALLAKGLGNDGVIALAIDAAGGEITARANDLLLACCGPRFTVSIVTQRQTQKGEFRETFDIQVFDGERGDSKSIRDVSGGERVYINEAMTRAIALYQSQSTGARFECLFSDESDGALDAAKKRQFAMMKRKVLELGGYQREIYISHSPEVQEAADETISMREGIS